MANKTKSPSGQRGGKNKVRKGAGTFSLPRLPSVWTPPDPLLGWFDTNGPQYEPEWLVKKMIPRIGTGTLSGQWGKHKTHIAVDLSLSVTTGRDFAGRKVIEPAAVIYVAPERPASILPRFQVARRMANINQPLPFYVSPRCPQLTADGAADELIESVEKIKFAMRREYGVRTGLVVYDTVSSAAGWESENSNAEAQHVHNVFREVSEATRVFCLGVDHEGHTAGRTRGASAKEDFSDVVLRVSDKKMVLAKLSYGQQGRQFAYEALVHEIGRDSDGEAITECTIRWGDEKEVEEKAADERLTDRQKSAINALATLGDDVSLDAWRRQLLKQGVIDPKGSNPREDFKRLWKQLEKKDKIEINDDLVSLT